jgi:PEP-CTERM motif-containing protein
MYTQSELPAILAWSIGDASGAVSLSGTTFGPFQPFEDDGQLVTFPPLTLSTDANGNIVNYMMAVHVAPHLLVISNPPLTFEEDGMQFSLADGLTAFYAPDPGGSEEDEFDLFGSTPGRWTKVTSPQPVPEPGTLLLLSSGVVLLAGSRFRARRR